MIDLVKVANPVVMLYSSYSEEKVIHDKKCRMKGEEGGLLVDFPLQTQESSLS